MNMNEFVKMENTCANMAAQTRRSRVHSTHRTFRRTTAGPECVTAELESALGSTFHGDGTRLSSILASVLHGDSDCLDELAWLWAEHGWQPPPIAQREGGLWLLSPDAILSLPPAPATAIGPFAPLFDTAPPPTAAHDTPWSIVGKLPTIGCARPHGAPLPARALELVRAGMCCVLQDAQLWPAAEAAWASADYLRAGLRGACNVLDAPSDSRRFSYFFNPADRKMAGYAVSPLVVARSMSIDEYLAAGGLAGRQVEAGRLGRCLYLQQTVLQARTDGTGMAPCSGLSGGMARDVEFGINLPAVQSLAEAGGFGAWQRCQLFVGAATDGARSILHFDQYDNLVTACAPTAPTTFLDLLGPPGPPLHSPPRLPPPPRQYSSGPSSRSP